MATSLRVVLVTAPRGRRTEALARGIIETGLAACVNILPGVVSHYLWKGKPCRDSECILIIKPRASKLKAHERWIVSRHPYALPEVIALPVVAGSKNYLAWLRESVR